MKMYEIIEISRIYEQIKDRKMPLRIAYKFNRLMRRVTEELDFYQTKFSKIIETYAKKKDDGSYEFSPDGASVQIIPGKEAECNSKIMELRLLEIVIDDIAFTLEELDGLDLTIAELNYLMPLIKE